MIKEFFILSLIFGLTNNLNVKAANTDSIFDSSSQEEIKQYYQDIDTSNKESIFSSLQQILSNGQVKLSYETGIQSGGQDWDGYALLDRDYELSPLTQEEIDSNTWKTDDIWMRPLYSDVSIYVPDISEQSNKQDFKYIENGKEVTVNTSHVFDREHVMPKSYGFNVSGSDTYKKYIAGTDIHNLHLSDSTNNQSGHNNKVFGYVDHTSKNEVKNKITGHVTGYATDLIYEPLDSQKGDIARSIFYMATRYHTYVEKDFNNYPSPSLSLGNIDELYPSIENSNTSISPDDTKDNPAVYGLLDTLLLWNKLDPVDDAERYRNDLVYNAVQYNRNPFIDYPQWADILFGDSQKNIDLNNSNGVSNEELIISTPSDFPLSYEVGDNIDLSKLIFSINDGQGNIINLDNKDIDCYIFSDNEFTLYNSNTYLINQTTYLKVRTIYNSTLYESDIFTLQINDETTDKINSLEIVKSNNYKNNYSLNSSYNADDFVIYFYDSNSTRYQITPYVDDCKLVLKYNENEIEIESLPYILSEEGNYILYALYNRDNQEYISNNVSFTVGNNIDIGDQEYTLVLDPNKEFKVDYNSFEILNITAIPYYLYDRNQNIVDTSNCNVTFYLTDSYGNVEVLDESINLPASGTYTLEASIEYNGKTYNSINYLEINITFSTWFYFLIGGGIAIIVLVLFVSVLLNKKKRRKRK